MKTTLYALALLGGSALPALADFSAGGAAFTKRTDTALLEEPKPMAKSVARVGYGRQLRVDEVRGAWLLVSEKKSKGWVFSGNVAEKMPNDIKGSDGLPLEASKTSASVAARPLAPQAAAYADRHNAAQAKEDLRWLEEEADGLSAEDLRAYQEANKRGEFQEAPGGAL